MNEILASHEALFADNASSIFAMETSAQWLGKIT